ncbi:hypothetical protein L5515_009195 [Caenorhabditis briggsae]|uniref:Uncharacterized protein n=1 Tax=Caenorhabditis briggsae TaxID=6238 RepID=A0AAE9D2C6_CAEBR|nr:hypothetical protein L3Y34_009353 [Caenorhabditis briggsae]UMM37439.1 hypothetical protein L5515_009195 [Caenorhabditis briggsae]
MQPENLELVEKGQQQEENNDGKYSLQFSNKTIRAGFIRKVFGLIFIMLCIAAAATIVPMVHTPTRDIVRKHTLIPVGVFIISLATYFSILCCKGIRRKFPVNLIVAGIFTIATSIGLMVISAHLRPNFNVLLIELVICIGCTLSIIVFVSQTKFELTTRVGYIYIIFTCFVMFGIVFFVCPMFFTIKLQTLIIALVAALFMMIYLFYGIQLMMGGKRYEEITPEEYIFAAVEIFLTVVLRFAEILCLCILRR